MGFSASAPWLKYYGKTPATIEYPHLTMCQQVQSAARQFPNNIAYEFQNKKTTYAQFFAKIELTAKAYQELGICRGDRVVICMPNCPQAIDSFYALNRIGAIPTMIHPLSAATEIAFYINASHAKAILTLDRFYAKVAGIRSKLNDPLIILVARISDELPVPLGALYHLKSEAKYRIPSAPDVVAWNKFIANAQRSKSPLAPDIGKYDEGAAILFSGGTTGTTKGILLSNYNFNALAFQTAAASGFAPIDGLKMLSVMPLFHGFGLGIGIHTMLAGGATCILVPQFTVNSYADLLIKKRPNIIAGVPTLFEALLRAPKLENADLSFLVGMFSGGDSLSIELKKKVDRFLKEHNATIQIREGYGTTECVTASCLTPYDMNREGSIGVPFPDTYYKIVKPGTDQECEPHEEGEICLSGPSVMVCYVDNPEETNQTLRRHNDNRIWLHTGDLGFMDEDGFIYFRQRLKRMIISSGYNVYPSQLENIIDGHEKVLYSCVVGVKDDYRMQKIKAFIVLKPGIEGTESVKEELFAYCREHIAKYAMPYDIEFRAELPKTLVGKVAYRILEEEANAGL